MKGRLAETNNYINYINYMLNVKKRVQKAYSKHHFCVKHIHIVYSNVIQLYIDIVTQFYPLCWLRPIFG